MVHRRRTGQETRPYGAISVVRDMIIATATKPHLSLRNQMGSQKCRRGESQTRPSTVHRNGFVQRPPDPHPLPRLVGTRRGGRTVPTEILYRTRASGPEGIKPGTVFCAPEILHEGIGVSPVNGGPGENELEPEGTCSRRRCESPPAILWFLSHRWERNSPRRAKPCKMRRAESSRPTGVMIHGGRANLGAAPTTSQANHSRRGMREGQAPPLRGGGEAFCAGGCAKNTRPRRPFGKKAWRGLITIKCMIMYHF